MPAKRKFHFLRRMSRWLLLLFCVLVVYIVVIMLTPEAEENAQEPQALLTASPSVVLDSEDQLAGMIADFPVPVLASGGITTLKLIAGTSYDTAFEEGFARVLALRYVYQDTQIDVYSIYPARALSVLGRGDYHLSAAPSPLLAGWNSVRMENETTIRLHIQTSYGIYAVLVPHEAVGLLSEIVRPLQLMTVSQD